MTRLTLTHQELFALWTQATHWQRAPAYEIERDESGVLWLNRHDGRLYRRLTPEDAPTPQLQEGPQHGTH